jgi:hypothetical protein
VAAEVVIDAMALDVGVELTELAEEGEVFTRIL